MAAEFVTFTRASDNKCLKIAGAVKADTCTSATICTLKGYLLDCTKEDEEFLNEWPADVEFDLGSINMSL